MIRCHQRYDPGAPRISFEHIQNDEPKYGRVPYATLAAHYTAIVRDIHGRNERQDDGIEFGDSKGDADDRVSDVHLL